MSHHIPQVESELRRAISKVLQSKLSDPRIEGMVSVTRVQVSPDLHDAYIYVSVYPEKFQAKTLGGLKHATPHIYALVCKDVAIRTVPKLEFRLDESLKKQAAVLDAIRRGHRDDPPSAPEENRP